MPTIQRETVVAAGAVNDNIFAGSAFEYARGNAIVSLGAVASATGGFITIQAGPDVVLEESPPAILGTMPVIPDNFTYNFAMNAGDRLLLRFRNPTGGNLTIRATANITYV